jgi:hypothetical protein
MKRWNEWIIRKFTDGTKVDQKITTLEDKEKLQEILDTHNIWAKTWGMEFNLPKSKVMHAGSTNPKYYYTMENWKSRNDSRHQIHFRDYFGPSTDQTGESYF